MSFKTGFISFLLFLAIAGISFVILFMWGVKSSTASYSREAEIMSLNVQLAPILKDNVPSPWEINNFIDKYSYSIVVTDIDNMVITSNLDKKQEKRVSLGEQKITSPKNMQGPIFVDSPINNEMVKRVAKIYYEEFNVSPDETNRQFNIFFSIGVGLLFSLLFAIQAIRLERQKTGIIEELGSHIEWHEDEEEFSLEEEEKKARLAISSTLSEKIKKTDDLLKDCRT